MIQQTDTTDDDIMKEFNRIFYNPKTMKRDEVDEN